LSRAAAKVINATPKTPSEKCAADLPVKGFRVKAAQVDPLRTVRRFITRHFAAHGLRRQLEVDRAVKDGGYAPPDARILSFLTVAAMLLGSLTVILLFTTF